ncbi:PREDICTED: putative disease resistance protein At1g50180 [Nicotiana attenuata]|uniref:putative disease resistance protein At1g50180 n=1 Tax=Nicotiana attenuata TaxID=49451 RepID=UPI000904C51C|nr:PREDICTED: putative disease resistance protein At1g50180 [Nicotiana attenuata]
MSYYKLKPNKFDLEKLKSLVETIRVAANYAEDAVEVKIFQIIKGSSWTFGILQHEHLLPVFETMNTTKKEVMEIVSDLSTSSTHDADDYQTLELPRYSLIGTSYTSNQMLSYLENDIVQGFDDDLEIIVKRLTGLPSDLDIFTILGMGGFGETTLSRKTYDHLASRYHFDILAWATISQEFRSRNLLSDALRCILKHTNIVNMTMSWPIWYRKI